MTFDEFILRVAPEWSEWSTPYMKHQLQLAWNAAIEAALDVADTKVGVSDAGMWLLAGLKTPLEGPNDSEVRAS